VWSIGCIALELFTGEVFFHTFDNIEHLALIGKNSGNFPFHMVQNSQNETIEYFDLNSPD
jgi:dual-specificity kinase